MACRTPDQTGERQAGLTSTVAEIMRRNPDLSLDAAKVLALRFIKDEEWRTEALRPTLAMSGALGGTAARADGAPVGGRPPEDEVDDAPDLSWVEEVVNAA